tara:strand:- start:251 stop:577 length:327 start_codon:yes stop_codon:yes gene_type:complete
MAANASTNTLYGTGSPLFHPASLTGWYLPITFLVEPFFLLLLLLLELLLFDEALVVDEDVDKSDAAGAAGAAGAANAAGAAGAAEDVDVGSEAAALVLCLESSTSSDS